MNNPGKRFEEDFKHSMDKACIRLYDTTNGFAGVKNPCDFIYYLYPYQYMFELKTTQYDKLEFNHITQNQWENLAYFSHVDGCNPIIVLEFRTQQRCFAIPFHIIENINKEKRHIKLIECLDIPEIKEMPCNYKRTRFDMDLIEFQKQLRDIAYNNVKSKVANEWR